MDAGGAFALLDPIALELSTIFHKDAPDHAGSSSASSRLSLPLREKGI
jgi:hypothetical protein